MKIQSIIGRRQFLKGAAVFGGLTALLGIVRPARAEQKEPQRQPGRFGRGYRLTEHIKKYYETARL